MYAAGESARNKQKKKECTNGFQTLAGWLDPTPHVVKLTPLEALHTMGMVHGVQCVH